MSNALAIIQDKELRAAIPLNKLQTVAVEQFARIARDTRDTPLRAILLGITLNEVKASMPHGTFEAWKKANVTAGNIWSESTTRKNCSFYMRLALAALDEVGVTKSELLALPADRSQLTLATANGSAGEFRSRLSDYVGERSLEEILRDEGIKEGGSAVKKRKVGKKDSKTAAATEDQEQTVQERCNEIAGLVDLARKGALDHGAWMSASQKQHKMLKDIFCHAASEVTERYVKTHGNKK